MSEKIQKKQRNAKIWLAIALATLVSFAAAIAFFDENDAIIAVLLLSLYLGMVAWLVYAIKYAGFLSNQKWLQKRELGHIMNTFSENDPVYPKSKIRCGHQGLMHTKSLIAIPYSEIVWVYQHVTTSYGITTSRQLMLCCQDGKRFALPSAETEMPQILQNHIIPANQKIIIGFDAQRQRAYKTIVKNYKAQK